MAAYVSPRPLPPVTTWLIAAIVLTSLTAALGGIEIVGVAAVGTSVIAFALPDAWSYPQLGGTALAKALLIAWALELPDERCST